MDNRYKLIKERFSLLNKEEIQRMKDNIDKTCFDTFNFDKENNTYCPLAIALNLHNIVDEPTDELIKDTIAKDGRFKPVNMLKGEEGEFYRSNRKEDLISILNEF